MAKVYDCFTFYNENDMLDIRINVLKDVVDKFVIVEASKTHAGNDKPFNFNSERFENYKDKIIYVQVTDFPDFETSWTYENYQRNCIKKVLDDNCEPDDIVIVSDLDEIVNPQAVLKYAKKGNGITTLKQKFFYYYLNMQNMSTPNWDCVKILRYKDIETIENFKYTYSRALLESQNQGNTITKIRYLENCPVLKNGGWHFSYIGGVDKILEKLQNFSHQEFNTQQITNKDYILKMIKQKSDILGRGFKFEIIPINNSYPKYIRNNEEKLSEYIIKISLLDKIKYYFIFFIKKFVDIFICKDYMRIFILGIKIKYNFKRCKK